MDSYYLLVKGCGVTLLFIVMFLKVAWPLIKWLSNGNNRWCKTTFMITLSLAAAAATTAEWGLPPLFLFFYTYIKMAF